MKRYLALVLLLLLTSCSSNSFVVVSNPENAKISIKGIQDEKNSPADFGQLPSGSYTVTAWLPGYLPTTEEIHYDPNIKSSYRIVLQTEIPQEEIFKPGLPDKGVRVRSVPDAKTSKIIAFNVLNGAVGKWIDLQETPILADWTKLIDMSGVKNEFGTCALVECRAGNAVGYSFLAEAKDSYFQVLETPQISKPSQKLVQIDIKSNTVTPKSTEKTNQVFEVSLGENNQDKYAGSVKFSADEAFGKTLWSYVDEKGFQDVLLYENGQRKMLWHGEYGIGAIAHLPASAKICSMISDSLCAVALASETGYALGIINTQTGKLISKTPLKKFPKKIVVKKVGQTFAVFLEFMKDPISCLSFDSNGNAIALKTASNAEFTWLPCPIVNLDGKQYIFVNGMLVGFGMKNSKYLALLLR